MIGNLEPEEQVMREDHWMHDFQDALQELDWQPGDNIVVDIGGTQVSGIDVGEVYNEKWQSPIGTRKYNKDAFIVIKNLSRTPFEPSKPNPDLKAHHAE
jgi:hypothetical protein